MLEAVYNAPTRTRHPRTSIRQTLRRKTMKRSLRALLLLVGLVGTFAYAAIPRVPTPGGPMPLCPPSHPACEE